MKSTELTKAELEADHVVAGIAKWGEAERKGLQKQAREKSLETLRVEYDLRHAANEQATRQALESSMARQDAAGMPRVYAEFGLEGNS